MKGLVEAQGREALIIQGSTADEAHIDDLADQVVARWGSLDIWVNNAARIFVKPFLQLTTEQWHGLLYSSARWTPEDLDSIQAQLSLPMAHESE